MVKSNKMQDMYMQVRADPVRYIGEPDLNRLEAFNFGLILYLERSEGLLCNRLESFREFLVEGRCPEPGSAHGPAQVVLLNSNGPQEAFYRFYEFLEEFLELQDESYELFRITKPSEPFPIIEGGPTKVIWGLVNTDRAKIYAGGISLRLLESFISGVVHCAETFENKRFELLPGFDEYLRKRFQTGGEMNRYQIIQENSANDKEAFKNFYSWMQDFLKERGSDYEPVVER